MTVNIVSQLSIQYDTTFAGLLRMFRPESGRPGMTLMYTRQVNNRTWLHGELSDRCDDEPFARGVHQRAGGIWRTFQDQFFNPFKDDVLALETPAWAADLRTELLVQRAGFAALRPRLEVLHAARDRRFRDESSGYRYGSPKPERAWVDLPVVEYLEATGLNRATFTLVPQHLLRMATAGRVRPA